MQELSRRPPPRARSRRGFTLVEILVALVILATLTLMAQATYVSYMRESVEATLKHNLFQLRHAIQQFYADHGRYPYDGSDAFGNPVGFLDNSTSELTQGVRKCRDGAVGCDDPFPKNRVRYLLEIPIDPTTNQANWRLLPYDNDGDWETFSDVGNPGTPNDFTAGEGNGVWDAIEPLNDDVGFANYGKGDGKPTRGEPNVDEDPFGNGDEDGDGVIDNDPPDVRDIVSSNPVYEHL